MTNGLTLLLLGWLEAAELVSISGCKLDDEFFRLNRGLLL